MAQLSVKVDGSTVVGAYDIAYQDVLNDLGSGSFRLPFDAAAVPTTEFGDVVEVLLDSTVIGRWVIERVDRVQAADGEEADQDWSYSGRSVVSELERGIVYPATGVRDVVSPIFTGRLGFKPYSDERHLGPMDPHYDISGWGAAVEAAPMVGALSPIGWNDPDAMWLGGDYDYAHFAATFTTSGDFSVSIRFVMEEGELWVDGVLVARVDAAMDEPGLEKARRVVVEVQDGTHYIYARAVRIFNADCLFACSIYGRNSQTNDRRTDDTWKMLADDDASMTPHEIVDQLLGECQTRGTLAGWTFTSAATLDTAGDTWPTIAGGDFALRVGDTMLDVLSQLAESWIDFAVLPSDGARELSMWIAEGVDAPGGTGAGRGTTTAVTHALGGDIVELAHTRTA